MKRTCLVLAIGVFLTLMMISPSSAAEKVKFSIKTGGSLASISQGYDFSLSFDARDETGRLSETVPNVGSKFGFDIGLSVFPIPQLEVYASYSSCGGAALSDYSLTIPHFWYYDTPLNSKETGVENEFKASILSFGLAFHPAVKGKIKPYFGAGMSSVSVKVDLLKSLSVDDLVDYYYYESYYYPYFEEEVTEAIDITGVGFKEESETVWGFHVKAGVNIEVGKNISVFAEGRYLSATAKFDRPDITLKSKTILDYYIYLYGYVEEGTETSTAQEEVEVGNEGIEIKAGGLKGVVGIRFFF